MAQAEIKAKISLDNNPFTRGLRKSEEAAQAAGDKIKGYFSGFAAPLAALGPAIAAAFTGGAIIAGVRGVFDMARGMEEIADQTGISVGRVAMLAKSFRAAGLEAEDVGTVVNRLQKFIVNASETGAGGDVLSRLGTSALALRRMAPEEQLQTVGQAISHIRDPAERSRIAMELLGKSGGRLLGVFNSAAFAKAGGPLSQQAKLLQENADMFTRASIGLGQVGGIFRSFYLGIAEKVAGPFVAIMDALQKVNLVQVGEGFGGAIVIGASALVDMLLAFKKSGFIPDMKTMSDGLVTAGQVFRDFMIEGAKFIQQSVKEILGIYSVITGFVYDLEKRDVAGDQKREAAAKVEKEREAANESVPDRMVIDGNKWASALDDTSETGRRMWQRRREHPFDPGNQVEGAYGGLGDLQDSAGGARQHLKAIREQVRFQDPLLKGAALENAVRAAEKKDSDAVAVRKYRELHGSPLASDAGNNDPATEGGQKNITTAVNLLSGKLELLFAQ